MAGWNSALILPPPRKAAPPPPNPVRGVSGSSGPRFPMPLDHPSSGLHGVSGGVPAARQEQRAAPVRNIGPWRGGFGPGPIPKAAPARPAPNTFKGIPKTFEGAPKLARAYQKAPYEPTKLPKGGGGFDFGTILNLAPAVFPATAIPLIEKNVGEHVLGTGKAFVKEPIGVAKKTISSLPGIANSLAMQGVRLGEEGALGMSRKAGVPVPHGTGEFGKALGEFASEAAKSTAKIVGENQAEVEKEVTKEGAAPEILTYAPVGGGATSIVGRLTTRGIRATGIGEKELAATRVARDANIAAHQAPRMHEYLEGGKPIEMQSSGLGPVGKAKAFVAESTQPRPKLKNAPGERVGVERAAPVKPQERSSNLFRGMTQTALDNVRRGRQLGRLQRVVREVELFHHAYPDAKPGDVPVRYSAMLDNLTKQGEVTPLIQKGAIRFPGSYFAGATKAQRIGASYPKADLLRNMKNAGAETRAISEPAVKALTSVQRKLLGIAKEGLINLHDPELAVAHIKEVARQAKAGSKNGSLIPLVHRMMGSDVGRTMDAVLKEIDQKGVDRVITPEFEHLVRNVPDERIISGEDRVLQQIPDQVMARRIGPQLQTIEEEARHRIELARQRGEPLPPEHVATVHAAKRIHEKFEAAINARRAGVQAAREGNVESARDLHAEANAHMGEAHNLANELAERTGRPTDRAYIEHTPIRGRQNWMHVVGRSVPRVPQKWVGAFQRQGYRSLDPRLVEDAIHASINNNLRIDHIAGFHNDFAVSKRDNMTAKEAAAEMKRLGLSPDHYEIANILGRTIPGMADRFTGGSDLMHLDLTPSEQAKTMAELIDHARAVHGNDATRGANIYPTTALNELRGVLGHPSIYNRSYGKLKGTFSTGMLGTSPAWATNMSAVTYPTQAMLGGAPPWSAWGLGSAARFYRGWTEAQQRRFDIITSTDDPYSSTHVGGSEKLGSMRLPGRTGARIENLLGAMKLIRESPIGKILSKANLPRDIMAAERVPRRYARIGVGIRHMKMMALDRMLEEAKGLHAVHSKLEKAIIRIQHLGRMPSRQYMDEILRTRELAEEVTRRTERVLGDWHHTTVFERNVGSKIPLFYPWLRWSARLAASLLPSHHPIAYGFAGQLGLLSREELRNLLGTDTPIGKAPLGRAQPNKEPEEREWLWAGAPQVDPLLNAITALLPAAPSAIAGAVPPYISALIEYAMNRGSFTDKPLPTGAPYKAREQEENRPPFLPFYGRTVGEAFAPFRAAQKIAAGGQPQGAGSILGSEPRHLSPKTEAKIEEEKEQKNKEGTYGKIAKYALPLLPHREPGLLAVPLQEEKKKKEKEEKQAEEAGGGGIKPW